MSELASNPENSQVRPESQRRHRAVSSWAALLHIRSAFASKVKTRRDDKASNIALLFALAYAIPAFLYPDRSLQMFWIADIVFGLFFLSYVTLRFGIITTLNPRQTVLILELLICMILVGMYCAVNLGAGYILLHLRH
jgi:hypothetical protein